MPDYVTLSLESHLFFARIMKEHALFLEAGFPCVEKAWIERAEWFRQQFEGLLGETVRISNRNVGRKILESGELVTEYTLSAEKRTERLSGVPIDTRITMWEQELLPCGGNSRTITEAVYRINRRALELLKGLIALKENILEEVKHGRLFTSNYPLLIEHILREARLYQTQITQLQQNQPECNQPKFNQSEPLEEQGNESFWNRIMMEHALFIRGLLDPSEIMLIGTADEFAAEYAFLLEKAEKPDCGAGQGLTRKTLEETRKYRDFKAAGTEGILECKIASVILPLLADHVLREANHYIRLLEQGER